MWDGFNKRKFPRLNIHCEIDILSDDQKSPIHANTENIGVGGVCVILDKALERFSKCRVKLDFSEKHEMDCEAKVVWIVPTREAKSTKKRFDTGLEFVGLEADQLAILRSFIQKSVS
jgi:hypothetical protein